MKKFTFKEGKIETITKKVRRLIKAGPMGSIVKFEHKGSQFDIHFSQFGTSRILYDIAENETGFVASLAREDIKFTHKAFQNEVKNYLVTILKKVGADVE